MRTNRIERREHERRKGRDRRNSVDRRKNKRETPERRKEIRREDKKFWTSRSMRKYLFSKFDDALYSRITDERTRTKIVNYYIDQEYSNQLNNVNLYITIVMSIVLVIGVLVYEQMNKKKTVFRLKWIFRFKK